jgi:Holliday junction DNA helicase RuvA
VFYYLEGTITILEPNLAVCDCGGVGYAVNTTTNTAARLHVGETARLYTYSIIREDCFDIYGFISLAEKNAFEMLIGVSGVGPKAAQSILSSNTPEAVGQAVFAGNERAFTAVPGIGKKTAQRILLELKDKMGGEVPGGGGFGPVPGPARADNRLAEAAAALSVLGYSGGEISAALKGIDPQELPVEDIVRMALKKML